MKPLPELGQSGAGSTRIHRMLEELQASAVREHAEVLRGTFGLIGLLLGALATYGLLGLYASEWPLPSRFLWAFSAESATSYGRCCSC